MHVGCMLDACFLYIHASMLATAWPHIIWACAYLQKRGQIISGTTANDLLASGILLSAIADASNHSGKNPFGQK